MTLSETGNIMSSVRLRKYSGILERIFKNEVLVLKFVKHVLTLSETGNIMPSVRLGKYSSILERIFKNKVLVLKFVKHNYTLVIAFLRVC